MKTFHIFRREFFGILMMQPFILFFIIVGFSFSASSQGFGPGNSATSGEGNIRGKLFSSSPVTAEGHPYLNALWGKGMVKLKNGTWYKDLMLQFDLQHNLLFFQRNSVAYTFTDTVVDFILSFENETQSNFTYLYRSGYPAMDRQTVTSFYEIVHDSKTLQLLKLNCKMIVPKSLYGQENKKEYKKIEQWYAYEVQNRRMVKIKADLHSLKKALPEYSGKMDKFTVKRKGWQQKEDLLPELFKFIEEG